MRFVDKLAALARVCVPEESAAPNYEASISIRENYRAWGVILASRAFAKLWIAQTEDCWSVMLITAAETSGPFWGADFSISDGDDADSALVAAWKHESSEWERCLSDEITMNCDRIERAVNLAYKQHFGDPANNVT